MKIYRTIIVFFVFLFYYIHSFAQANVLTFQQINNPVLQQYNIRHINTGLDGKLWLSTDDALLSFDGNDVKVYQHRDDDPTTLRTNNILKTYTDNKGNLFVLESRQMVDYLDVKTGKVNAADPIIKGEDARIMGEETDYSELFVDDGSIWMAMYYVGFSEYNMQTRKTNTYYFSGEYSGRNTVYAIKKDIGDKNLLWLGTEDGIYSFDKITKQVNRNFRCSHPLDSSATDLQVTNIEVINKDSIWFTVPGKGLGCYEIKNGFYTMYPFTNNPRKQKPAGIDILGMQKKDKNNFFIITKNSLPGIFNTVSHTYDFNVFTVQNQPAILLNHFLVDSSGNSWCLLYNRLYMAHSSQNKFSTVAINNYPGGNKKENFFKNIVWNNKQKLYYAVFEKSNEVFVLDSNLSFLKVIPIEETKNEPVQNSIFDIGIDQQNRIWLCGTSLYVYDNTSQKFVASDKVYRKLLFKEQWFQNMQFRGDYIYLQPSNNSCRAIYRISLKRMDYDSIPLPKEMVNDNANDNYQAVRRLDFLNIDKDGKNSYWGYFRKSYSGYIYGAIQYNLETLKARLVSRPSLIKPENSNHLFPYALDDSDRIWIGGDKGFDVYEPVNLNLINRIILDEALATSCGLMYNAKEKNLMCRLSNDCVLVYDYRNNKKYRLTLNDGLISYLNSGIAVANNFLFTGTGNYIQYIPLTSIISRPTTNRKCYLSSVQLFNQPYETDTLSAYLHTLTLPHDKNFITLTFSSTEFEQPERLEYRYKMDGVDKDWVYVNYLNRTISYNDLQPDNYIFHAEVKSDDGKWSDDGINLFINIVPAWWQTTWFKIVAVIIAGILIDLIVTWRIKSVRKQEQLKGRYEKELLELEAKALRAQMNPHFIFNCMNSIKSLIQEDEKSKAVLYLTTFSKLIRTVFQNSDKREITFYDEIETCRLYTQLESMRFGNKFSYSFNIDETLDLRSVMVPALIIQPFIENAIWHGIMPKEEGGKVTVSVQRINNMLQCTIDDNGIGREMSMQNKFQGEPSTHQSKGVHLTQARLNLHNLLNERNGNTEIIDKKDAEGNVTGTTVIVSFNEY